MVIYKIEKRFTGGLFEGLSHIDFIPFVTKAAAMRWKVGVLRNIESGTLNYDLVDFKLVNNKINHKTT